MFQQPLHPLCCCRPAKRARHDLANDESDSALTLPRSKLQGLRSFPHQDGNFATTVFIPGRAMLNMHCLMRNVCGVVCMLHHESSVCKVQCALMMLRLQRYRRHTIRYLQRKPTKQLMYAMVPRARTILSNHVFSAAQKSCSNAAHCRMGWRSY